MGNVPENERRAWEDLRYFFPDAAVFPSARHARSASPHEQKQSRIRRYAFLHLCSARDAADAAASCRHLRALLPFRAECFPQQADPRHYRFFHQLIFLQNYQNFIVTIIVIRTTAVFILI